MTFVENIPNSFIEAVRDCAWIELNCGEFLKLFLSSKRKYYRLYCSGGGKVGRLLSCYVVTLLRWKVGMLFDSEC